MVGWICEGCVPGLPLCRGGCVLCREGCVPELSLYRGAVHMRIRLWGTWGGACAWAFAAATGHYRTLCPMCDNLPFM